MELDDVRVVRLPEGKDPDEVMRDEPDRWREEVRTARPIVDHLIDVHARAHDLRTPGGQARFVDAVLPIIRNLPNPVLRDAYLGRVRQVSGVEERTLLEAMHRRGGAGDAGTGATAGGQRPVHRRRRDATPPTRCPVTEILRGVSRTEQELLRLVLLVPEAHDARARRAWARTGCPSQVARELFRAVVLARAPRRPRRAARRSSLTAILDGARRGEPRARPGARLAPGPQPPGPRGPRRSPTRSSA